jgi:hypothetical protein
MLVLGGVTTLLGVLLYEYVPRIFWPRLPEPGRAPKQLPYREGETVGPRVDSAVPEIPIGPVVDCPRCGAPGLECTNCTGSKGTAHVIGERHNCVVQGTGVFKHVAANGGRYMLTFTHGTSPTRLCSPERRARYGFLLLTQCTALGVHVHQTCERCAWRGIARIEKEGAA